jgi:hypothetical protein
MGRRPPPPGAALRWPRMHPNGYFALVLTPASSARLTEALATLGDSVAHHCTVAHGTRDPRDLPGAFTPADLGARFHLRVRGFATRADEGVQAAVVALVLADGRVVEEGFSANRVPHVTVATDGVCEPSAANALLEAGFDALDGPVLEATLLHSDAWTPPAEGA